MKNNLFKRGISLLLALAVCFLNLAGLGMTAVAADKEEVYVINLPRADEPNKNGWGHPAMDFMNGWSMFDADYVTAQAVGDYEGNCCYCIEPGVPLFTGNKLSKKAESFWDNYPAKYNKTISPDMIKVLLGRIMQYGYTGKNSIDWVTDKPKEADACANYLATQLLVWETIVGERDEDFKKINAHSYDKKNVKQCIQSNHPLRTEIFEHYDDIVANVQAHTVIPSFTARSASKAQTEELVFNGTNYSVTLTDTNGVLSKYDFSADGLSFSKSGNKLTITADKALTGTVKITADKKNSNRKALVTWTDEVISPDTNQMQDIVTYGQSVSDPVKAVLKAKTGYGSVKIVKASEDGEVEDIRFHITGNGIDKDVATGKNGEIQIDDLVPGVYSITEQAYDKYEPQETHKVTVVGGQTTTVTFNNKLKRGSLKVTKTSEDNLNAGVKFRLTGTSLSGLKVDAYAVSDSSGTATFKDVLIGTGYILSEVDTDVRYVVPTNQTAAVEWNKVTSKTVHNVLKKWNAVVTKSDKQTGEAQGGATLAGAVYGVYKGDKLVDTYTTDLNGEFTTKYYACGSDWSIREITSSAGYLVDKTIYHVGAEPQPYTIEYNSTAMEVFETVKKGRVAVVKHCDDGTTQIETPEKGAEFEVYLKSAGSYADAKDAEHDILICDENGFAQTKLLPYGVYTVRQTKGWEGNELMSSFDVFISEDNEIYRYIINNAVFKALIEIVKKDVETGEIIPAAGVGFKVKDIAAGEYVTQHVNYPTPMDIDTFYTDSNGKLMMPEKLPLGRYELVEVQTCYGYVLDSKPVPFNVDGSQIVVTVEKHNIAQKGTITVFKSGEVFSSVTQADGCYQPVYSVGGLKEAEYEISAAEDIRTADGTVRYKKGETVEKIVTGANGRAQSGLLYLGRYALKETKAPYGMVLNPEPKTVELAYAGQEIEVTAANVQFNNERQRVQIRLDKAMEHDKNFDIGMNSEILSVRFGLYAAEDLTAADGTTVPKDGLIEIVSCDEDGKAAFETDLPLNAKLYVKEYSTDEHYLISETVYLVETEYTGQYNAVVVIPVNDGKTIENSMIRGRVIGKKTDEDGFAICGAVFGLFKPDETEFTEQTAIISSESNEIGVFGFDNLPYGKWLVRELKPAPAFVLDTTVYPIAISENEQTVELKIENRFIIGSVQTVKTDAEYPDHKLSGAAFEIYVDVNDDKVFNAEVDRLVGEMCEAENGVYRMDKLRYNGYFLYEKSAPAGFVKDDNYHYFEIRSDGETVAVGNEAGECFANRPIIGELKITKKDVSDGKLLPNAGFRIKDEGGNTVTEGYTDKHGVAEFKLRFGKYTYEEFDAPDGYIVDTTPYEFKITEDGQIVKSEMTNEKLPRPGIPKTGDSSKLGLWTGLCGVAAGTLAACTVLGFRKKKEKKRK